MTRLTFTQDYPGGRMLARLGSIDVGAVFPPAGETVIHRAWVWRCWLPRVAEEGRAKTEHAAKNALLASVSDWLRAAGLEQVTT